MLLLASVSVQSNVLNTLLTMCLDFNDPSRNSPSSDGSFMTAPGPPDMSASPVNPSNLPNIQTQHTVEKKPERVLYTPSTNSSRASSLFDSSLLGLEDVMEEVATEYDGYDSPPPANDRMAEIRNERRYRLLLTHEFHLSRE